jgi:hypothetical protein
MARCRDCRLYDLDAVKNARGAIMRNRVGRCLWKSTEVYPASLAKDAYRMSGGWMEPDDGARCKRFIKRAPNDQEGE